MTRKHYSSDNLAVCDSFLPPVTALIICVLGVYSLFDSVFSEVVSGQRLVYAAVVGICLLVIVASIKRFNCSKVILGLSLVWVICLSFWLIPSHENDFIYVTYIVGDIVSIALPLLLLFAGVISPDLFRLRMSLILLGAFLLAGAVISIGLGGVAGLERFEPPHNALVTLAWLMFFRNRGMVRWLALSLLVVILIISFQSGARTTVVLWFSGLFFLVLLHWSVRRIVLVSMLLALVLMLSSGVVIRQAFNAVISDTRFQANIEGEADESLLSRLFEAQDALGQFHRQAGPLNYALGFGHGATFRSIYAPLRNATNDGVVHNIHFGPVMILYRYGLIGVIAYLALIGFLIASFLSQRKRISVCTGNELFFSFTLSLYLLDGLLRNVFVDPVFSYVLAGYIFYRCNTKVLTVSVEAGNQAVLGASFPVQLVAEDGSHAV